jgi:signal transduction histidine kinase
VGYPRLSADDSAGGHAQLHALAELSTHLFDGSACLISWQTADEHASTRAVSDPRLNFRLDSVLAEVESNLSYQRFRRSRAKRRGSALRLGDRELAVVNGRRSSERTYVTGAISITSGGEAATLATAILIAPALSLTHDLQVAVELIAHAAIGIVNTCVANNSRDFWRTRGIDFAGQIARLKSAQASDGMERALIERAVTAISKLRARTRMNGLGDLLAKLGPFDAWIIATIEEGELKLAGCSATLSSAPANELRNMRASTLAECFQRQSAIVRMGGAPTNRYAEDRIFLSFAGYACVPFASGAIALATREPIDARAVARVEAVVARANPSIEKWLLEAESDRWRGLVRNLGLRMFGAVDSERARIARDLHDHQAQLLAAARIGIEAGPDQARGIFKHLEDDLRMRVRELKPPSLGRSTLAEALRNELRRLAASGIKSRLANADRMDALTRPVQQLCYQVAREALANVIRHAHASRVDIGIEKRGALVRLSIFDNGTGIRTASVTKSKAGSGSMSSESLSKAQALKGSSRKGFGGADDPGASCLNIVTDSRGIGLDGLKERLELMGGRLLMESKAGSTRLVAEIPEPI